MPSSRLWGLSGWQASGPQPSYSQSCCRKMNTCTIGRVSQSVQIQNEHFVYGMNLYSKLAFCSFLTWGSGWRLLLVFGAEKSPSDFSQQHIWCTLNTDEQPAFCRLMISSSNNLWNYFLTASFLLFLKFQVFSCKLLVVFALLNKRNGLVTRKLRVCSMSQLLQPAGICKASAPQLLRKRHWSVDAPCKYTYSPLSAMFHWYVQFREPDGGLSNSYWGPSPCVRAHKNCVNFCSPRFSLNLTTYCYQSHKKKCNRVTIKLLRAVGRLCTYYSQKISFILFIFCMVIMCQDFFCSSFFMACFAGFVPALFSAPREHWAVEHIVLFLLFRDL